MEGVGGVVGDLIGLGDCGAGLDDNFELGWRKSDVKWHIGIDL